MDQGKNDGAVLLTGAQQATCEAETGNVFAIQPFSVDDGPGIRTAIFLKGCDARCLWCHNPESISPGPQLSFLASKCVHCGACQAVCPGAHTVSEGKHEINWANCAARGACVKACPAGALSMIGKTMTVREAMDSALRDSRYYGGTGGGVTITGGEPMVQAGFTKALLVYAKRHGLHTAIETNGAAPFQKYEELLPYLDLVLFDYKATGNGQYERLTGLDRETVLCNLRHFSERGVNIVLRCPMIPRVNATPGHLDCIAELTRTYGNILGFELMPYHALGTSKAKQTGMDAHPFETPDVQTVMEWERHILAKGGRKLEGI
ncbi:MAG TPA: glycyl-radical enzyme activating protein [Feifaniaceae bacterium]|nr:glycyl-radical enzyme activating protein [Feifaniaceae bacterium]